MEKVAMCVAKVGQMFKALERGDQAAVETLAAECSELEHQADQVKHDIQDHLPKSLFMAIDRGRLLEILRTQDAIADKAENVGVLLTLKPLKLMDWLKADLDVFLAKNFEAFAAAQRIINELDELLETGFGGDEAERVLSMVRNVAQLEHEADVIQRQLLKGLFAHEAEMSMGEFYLWTRLLKQVSELSNLSESLANWIRRTLELKN
jgi:hypothetical protein